LQENEEKSKKKINRKIRGAVRNIYLLFNKKITFIMASEWESGASGKTKIEKLI